MALKIWRGDAPAVAQVTHVEAEDVEAGDQFTIAINGKAITVTAQTASATNVATQLAAAIGASSIAEFREVSASVSGSILVLTANTAGMPFEITTSATNGGTGGVTVTTVQQGSSGTSAANQTQTFRIPLTAAGTFRVVLSGVQTSAIAVGASAATVETALEALSGIGAGNCSVSKSTDATDDIYEVEIDGGLAGDDLPTMTVRLLSTKPVIRTISDGSHVEPVVPETQSITVGINRNFNNIASGVTYTLTLSGQTTAPIDLDATSLAVQEALNALPNVSSAPVSHDADSYTVHIFGLSGAENLDQLVASTLSGSATIEIRSLCVVVPADPGTSPQNEQQLVTLPTVPTGGTFTLTFSGQTTSSLAYNASAATVQAALEALSNIGSMNVSVTGSAGGPWTVEWIASMQMANQPQMTGNGSGLTGGATQGFSVTTWVASEGPNHWDTPENWLPTGVPATGDDVRFEIGNSDCLYGLDQTGVTLASLYVAMSYAGSIGLPRVNSSGYLEYRTAALTLGATSILIGHGDGSGPNKVNLNTLAVQTTIEIRSSGGSSEASIPTVTWRGSHASNAVKVIDGDFGTSPYSDQSSVIDVLTQYGGTVALKHTELNELYAFNQSITAFDCTLSGGPLEL